MKPSEAIENKFQWCLTIAKMLIDRDIRLKNDDADAYINAVVEEFNLGKGFVDTCRAYRMSKMRTVDDFAADLAKIGVSDDVKQKSLEVLRAVSPNTAAVLTTLVADEHNRNKIEEVEDGGSSES